MTDKPQTLAEQALKLAGLQERMDAIGNQKQNHKPIIDCLRDCAAALADAAATTTPAQRAGDVGQAVPEWGTSDKAQHYAAMVTDTNDADILRATIIAQAAELERLRAALSMQIRNCPVCKGSGMAVSGYELLTYHKHGRTEPVEEPCNWCSAGRDALGGNPL